MKCILLNKNTEIAEVEYDANLDGFSEIYNLIHIEFAPVIVKKCYNDHPEDLLKTFSTWFRNRGIPSWRDQLDVLLARLGVSSPEELLNKSFGLSLADQYWLKPVDVDISYDQINFFDHDFDSAAFLDASFSDSTSSHITPASLKSPNNTTDGMLKKAWVSENGMRYLLKGGYKGDSLQPFVEVLATKICERLGFSHVPYSLEVVKGKIASKCVCFTTKDTEIIPAYQVLYGYEKRDGSDYETYINLLEKADLKNAREHLENMLVLDFLIMNEDRHLNNFGVIRDVNTLEWLAPAPIFDSGQGLNVLSYGDDGISVKGEGRFFYNLESFDEIITHVRNFSRFNLAKLDGVSAEFRRLLEEYEEISGIRTGRIDALCKVLDMQIEKLKNLAQ